ncbi:hypothetical protein U9M48_020664 [Paspalum notatum var. saurae]|uniref:Protein kinase domain-containing protein n=1 Tax=Paspalum notatum var. saurae TaxID=547442 RepID=A0AAQ3THA5_PASNO
MVPFVFIIVAGTLRDGSVVAVKRLYKNSYRSVEQFQNEVEILSQLRHPNLVTLYGCTSPRSSRDLLLVYEFVPNGTLADHLHGARASAAAQAQPPPLSWPTRLGIAVEAASALDYLHAVEPHQVVHRDVKTNNILLDEAFHVKVADFGLSRLFPAHATHVSTAPQGTPGYVDPMYHQCYQLTDKSDVYSFGVVLVELISSKPAVDMNRTGADVNLSNMAVHMIQCYEIDRLVDPRIGYRTDGGTKRTVDLVAEVAFRCLQPEQEVRPPISEVLGVLREAQQRMEQDGGGKVKDDDVGLLKKSRDGSPDSVMFQWTSPSTTAHNKRLPNATGTSPPCPSYRCGHAVDIRYPFWIDDDDRTASPGNASSSSPPSRSHCGYPSLRLECRRDTPVLPLPSGDYAVTHILYGDRTLSLLDLGVFSLSNTCPLVGRNLSLPAGSPLALTPRDANLTFFLHCSFVGIPAHLVACLEGDGRHHSYVFRDGDELAPPYGYAGLCRDVVGMPVLRRSLPGGAGGSTSPLDAVVSALSMGFELSWRPEADGECGQCERAGGMCGRPMVLLAVLASTTATVAAAQNTSSTARCAPVPCGNLTVASPFWLAGGTHQPPECGSHKDFQVTCDDKGGKVFLKNSFWDYQILDIFYENNSFVLTNVDLPGWDGTCNPSWLFSNASTDLSLGPFTISPQNQKLLFVYGYGLAVCHPPATRVPRSSPWARVKCADRSNDSFALLAAGNYTAGDTSPVMALPGTCNLSMMPVLGYQGATGADYRRLLKRGFLLNYTTKVDDDGGKCPRVVLLLLPLLAAALDVNCTPASCGNLSIRYPFWLRGHQPSYCGYPSFGIACDPTGASAPSLNDSYLRVLDIHYGNRSVVAFHTNLADDPTGCRATRFNMSTSLALSVLAVSRAKWELFLSTNCLGQPPAG